MKYQYQNAEKTMILIDHGENHSEVIEPGHSQWDEAVKAGPAEYIPTPPAPKDFVTRREFCLRLANLKVLNEDDALAAAKGEWPAALDSFLPLLDAGQALDAQIEWAAATIVERNNPLVLTLGSWLSLPDETLSAIFA